MAWRRFGMLIGAIMLCVVRGQCGYVLESMTTVTLRNSGFDLAEMAIRANTSGTMLLLSELYGNRAFVVGVQDGSTTALPDVSVRAGANSHGVAWRWWGELVVADRHAAWSSGTIVLSPQTLVEEGATSVVEMARDSEGKGRLYLDIRDLQVTGSVRIVRGTDKALVVSSDGQSHRLRGVVKETGSGDCLISFGTQLQAIWTSRSAALSYLPSIGVQDGGFCGLTDHAAIGIRDVVGEEVSEAEKEDPVVDNRLVVFDRDLGVMSENALGLSGPIDVLDCTGDCVVVLKAREIDDALVVLRFQREGTL